MGILSYDILMGDISTNPAKELPTHILGISLSSGLIRCEIDICVIIGFKFNVWMGHQ